MREVWCLNFYEYFYEFSESILKFVDAHRFRSGTWKLTGGFVLGIAKIYKVQAVTVQGRFLLVLCLGIELFFIFFLLF